MASARSGYKTETGRSICSLKSGRGKWTVAYIFKHGLAESLGLIDDIVAEHLLGGLILLEELSVLVEIEIGVAELVRLLEDEGASSGRHIDTNYFLLFYLINY